jgi:E3 ubiquitin-protein ligase DOA10
MTENNSTIIEMESVDLSEQYSCKICLESVNRNEYPQVFKPCQCEYFVHKACLETQLKSKFQTNCEICTKPYIFNVYHSTTPSDLENNITLSINVSTESISSDEPPYNRSGHCGEFITGVICIAIMYLLFRFIAWLLHSSD